MTEPEMARVIVLGGRRFVAHNKPTVRFSRWMAGMLLKFGLDKITKLQSEPDEKFVERILTEMFVTGAAIEFLGALLLPEGTTSRDWTPAMAEEQRLFIDDLTEPEDHAALRPVVAEMMIGFFVKGISSLEITPTSSSQPESESLPTASEPPTSLESGASSSESLENGTPTTTNES